MGERIQQERAKAFKQQQCRAYEDELGRANLFSGREDLLERSFCGEALEPIPQLVGKRVLVVPDEKGVGIVDGNVAIGVITDEDAVVLAEAIVREPHCPGFAVGVIDDASAITNEFQIRLIDHSGEDE
jgi:hypothetical protein